MHEELKPKGWGSRERVALVAEVLRQKRMVEWLCEQLQGINVKTWKNDLTGPPNCPLPDEFSCDGRDKCAECWRRAAEQAVAEEISPKG